MKLINTSIYFKTILNDTKEYYDVKSITSAASHPRSHSPK